jgi:hypothetical protein
VTKQPAQQDAIENVLSNGSEAQQDARPNPGNKDVAMKMPNALPISKSAILAIAEIKAATAAFDRGETNVFDALDVIAVAVVAHQNAMASRRDAA